MCSAARRQQLALSAAAMIDWRPPADAAASRVHGDIRGDSTYVTIRSDFLNLSDHYPVGSFNQNEMRFRFNPESIKVRIGSFLL